MLNFRFCMFFLMSMFFGCSVANVCARPIMKPVVDFQKKVEAARESFEDVYYEQIKLGSKGVFDDYYNNNVIIGTNLDGNFYENGQILLFLIDWLEKNSNRDSWYLLKKINKYFYLQLYKLVNQIDMVNKKEGRLLGLLHELYHIKLPTPRGIVSPFRSSLSQMSILIAIFNTSPLPYDKKREALNFMLDKVQKELLVKNSELLEKKIDDNKIKEFIQAMQTFATNEPLVKSSVIKKILLSIIIVGVGVALAYIAWLYLSPKKEDIKKWLNDFFNPAEKIAKNVIREIKEQFPPMLEEGLHRLANKHNEGVGAGREIPNPDLKIIGKQLGGGLLKGIWEESKEKVKDVSLAIPRGSWAGVVRLCRYIWGVRDEQGAAPAAEPAQPDSPAEP